MKKRFYIEDREQMVWVPVLSVINGVPMVYGATKELSDSDIQKAEQWCNAHGFNWMVCTRVIS